MARILTTLDPLIKEDGKLTTLGSIGGDVSEIEKELAKKASKSTDLGNIQFRMNDGAIQYKPKNGEWTNFSGGIPDAVLVWQNPNPSQPFIAQDITISEEFDYYIFLMRRSTTIATTYLAMAEKNKTTYLGGMRDNEYKGCRLTIVDGTKISISTFTAGTGGDNSSCIPVDIFGINLHLG